MDPIPVKALRRPAAMEGRTGDRSETGSAPPEKERAVSPAKDDHDPHPISHPDLSPGESARQRGEDPSNAIGPWPTKPADPRDPDPKFQPDPNQLTARLLQPRVMRI